MPAEFLDLVKLVGTLVFFAIAGIIAFMLIVSLIDRNPKRKAHSERQLDEKPAKSQPQGKDAG